MTGNERQSDHHGWFGRRDRMRGKAITTLRAARVILTSPYVGSDLRVNDVHELAFSRSCRTVM